MKNISLLAELLETSANACRAFIKSEIALNDGDLESCQKFSKDGQILVSALINDTFKEINELGNNDGEKNDYDYPYNFELIKSLNEISVCVGEYMSANEDESLLRIVMPNLFRAVNTTKEIVLALFEN